ncbi:hypothetical protein AB0L64_32690 [Kribbella sp. NPDC051936]|uniref:hypothetical protein n=1 Tax=Kribbella sp. NPDC051936 TaxID=3154946 RepID=UPI003426008C
MNTDLEPPRVPPLTAAEHARLRNRVLDKARPAAHRPARRWVAPAVGVGAVAAVVAGTLAVANNSSDDASVAGTTLQASPEAKVGVDLGAVQQRDLAKIVTECQFPGEGGPAQIIWSRHVRGITKDSTALVAVALNTKKAPAPKTTVTRGGRKPGTGGAPSDAKLGYRYCLTRTPASAKLGSVGSVGRVPDKNWQTQPTDRRALVTLGSENANLTYARTTLQAWAVYRALPTVATVEARYVLDGQPGPWTKGVVEDGFAYTEVQARGKFAVGEKLTTEVRAFDARGKQIPVG